MILSPFKKEIYNDRFISCRAAFESNGNDFGTNLELLSNFSKKNSTATTPGSSTSTAGDSSPSASPVSQGCCEEEHGGDNQKLYTALLQNQVLGIKDPFLMNELNENSCNQCSGSRISGCCDDEDSGFSCGYKKTSNVLKFRHENNQKSPYLASPALGFDEEDLLLPSKKIRKIPKTPYKVLDAPALQDDFYLNLVDWSNSNTLCVGLGSCVYLWSATTSKVTKLYDLGNDSVTAVNWSQRGSHLAVGTNSGLLQIWDVNKNKMIRSLSGHDARIGTVAWSTNIVSSGSRDKSILQRDLRTNSNYFARLSHHKQEVCGLKWSPDEQQLASGGNDNKLYVWSAQNHTTPVHKFSAHSAAVKAIAWSPHQHGLLASGGGTADRCIRFWNTLSGTCINTVETGSQVCNLLFSKNVNEIVSTHGYSQNQIVLWSYPKMKKVSTLTGHTYRVLYLAMSPDGQNIVTGAGDETLRFWNLFPAKKTKEKEASRIVPSQMDVR